MRISLLLFFVILLTPKNGISTEANILKGNTNTTGSISFAQTFRSKGTNNSTLTLILGLQYFVMDHLCVGGHLTFDHPVSSRDTLYLGPTLNYFFWQEGKIASFIGASYTFGLTDPSATGHFNNTLGLYLFPQPALAYGPWVTWRRVIARHEPDYNQLLMGANAAIFW